MNFLLREFIYLHRTDARYKINDSFSGHNVNCFDHTNMEIITADYQVFSADENKISIKVLNCSYANNQL